MKAMSGALVAALGLAVAATAVAQQQLVKIAHVGALSGPASHLGKDNENGARMAVDELNAKGFVIGGRKTRFELLTEDDAGDPRQGTTVAQKLVDAKVAGVIGHMNSGTTIPASRIYHDAGIPQITPSATNAKYTEQGFNTAFRVVANDSQLGGALGRYAAQKLSARRVAVIDDRTAYGQGLAQEFSKAVKAQGAQVVDREFTNDKASDFNAILTAIKAKNPDTVFFGGMDGVGGPLLRQMRSLGINARLIGGDGICSENMVKLAGAEVGDDRVYCGEAGGVDATRRKELDAFKSAYRKKFGIDVLVYAPYSYDATMAMADAMKRAGSAEPAKYLPELARSNYKGVTGDIAFDGKGDIKNGAVTLYTFRKGQRVQLDVVR